MNFTIGFSPCPNDTFIFYALLNHKIDTKGFSFTPVIEDVETLNLKAFTNEIDITKISFAAFLYAEQQYVLLNSGSALGTNCGPLLISKKEIPPTRIPSCSVAIPGRFTTANFLFDIFFPDHNEKKEIVFSEIENTVLNEVTDTGVIIHENRFTYQKKGLKKVADLGELWEKQTGHPIPLGGIVIKKILGKEIAKTVESLIRESILYAFAHPAEAIEYVKLYAQEMDEAVMWQHIHLYVNNFSVDLGHDGRSAVHAFFNYAVERKMVRGKSKELLQSLILSAEK